MNTYNEGMLDLFQYVLLALDMIDMFALIDLSFFHSLDREFLPFVILGPAHSHVSEGAYLT